MRLSTTARSRSWIDHPRSTAKREKDGQLDRHHAVYLRTDGADDVISCCDRIGPMPMPVFLERLAGFLR
eukprot:9054304-Prorocentrum_lima.AAC.1